MKATILVGDCRERMAEMEPDSIDAIVTDPPYALTAGKKGGTGEASVTLANPYGRARITAGFMGQKWDGSIPGVDFWTAAIRVAKPGAQMLAFGGTRTHHRLICAIEDAGWEIRDCLSWLYGSGFPKSLDVSKAIDRKRHDGEQIRAVTRWVAASRTAARITNADIDAAFGFNGMAGHWTTQGEQAAVPTLDQWPRLMRVLNVESVPPEIQTLAVDLNGHKGQPGASWFQREVVGRRSGAMNNSATSTASSFTKGDVGWNPEFDVTSPATDAARLWSGWGTALKPAWEPIVLARKPLTGTVAANVQRFGTGAINVDACRIGTGADKGVWPITDRSNSRPYQGQMQEPKETDSTKGRWPANVLLDEQAAAMLDEQSGEQRSGIAVGGDGNASSIYGSRLQKHEAGSFGFGDSGGASRFFFTAKASSADRNDGLPDGQRSVHPTVKPFDLMRWLVRLVTPPGGTVLDPFAGSGSTGVAALAESFNFIGIELDPTYAAIAERRIANVAPLLAEVQAETAAKKEPETQFELDITGAP